MNYKVPLRSYIGLLSVVFVFLWPFSSDEDRCKYLYNEIDKNGGITQERMEKITRKPNIYGSDLSYFYAIEEWCKKKIFN